jgi:uncharacterized SAM-binding protein YcdF (DUF218 family)
VTGIITFAKDNFWLGNIAVSLVLLTIGAVLLFARPRWGRRWMVAMVLVYWIASTPFGSTVLISPLVYRFHSIEDPKEAASAGAIVVLGGGIRAVKARTEALVYPWDSSSLRALEGARVFRLLEGRPLVIASGGITNAARKTSEGVLLADALAELNVPRDRIVIEDTSLTTHEQAINVTHLLKSHGINRFVLVTSPTHMLRAAAVFRAQDADVIPSVTALAPERARTPPFFMPNEDSLQVSDSALYDYAGVLYYWSKGWLRATPAQARP